MMGESFWESPQKNQQKEGEMDKTSSMWVESFTYVWPAPLHTEALKL